MEAARSPWPALGVLLVRDGLVSPDELEDVLAARNGEAPSRLTSRRLGEAMVERGLVTSAQVARLVAEQHELPFVDLEDPDATVPLAVRLPEELARRYSALPIRIFPDASLLVVVADPTMPGIYDEIRRAVGVPIRLAVASPEAVEAAIDAACAERRFGVTAVDPPELEPVAYALEPPVTPTDEPDESTWPVLGSLLLRDGLVTEHELETALAQQRLSTTRRLGEILVQRGSLTERQLAQALAEQHELPFVDLHEQDVDAEAAARLPVELAREHEMLPVAILPDDTLVVAVADPTSALQSEFLQAALGSFELTVAPPDEIREAIARLDRTPTASPHPIVEPEPEPPAEPEPDVEEIPEPPELTVLEGGPEPTRALTAEIEAALALGASAVHVVSRGDGLAVRARIDGALQEIATVDSSERESMAAALAELAGPRRATFTVAGRTVELRAAVLPTVLGERVTFRVVGDDVLPGSLADLLGDSTQAETLRSALERPRGLVLLCSPAPDERTALLHAALGEIEDPARTAISIEDPVEHLLNGVEQVEVDPRAGVTFATGLHTILRSDADVAAVGELVDSETARLATGGARRCLVLAGLSADGAATGVRRLLDLGAEPAIAAEALSCVVAVRRVRRACLACRASAYATPELLELLGRPPEESGRRLLAVSRGCDACSGTGLAGWAPVAEVIPLDDRVRRLVATGASAAEIEVAAAADGMRTAVDLAVDLCLEGVTTPSEVARLRSSGA